MTLIFKHSTKVFCGFCDQPAVLHDDPFTDNERVVSCPRFINTNESPFTPNGEYPTFDYSGSYDNPVPLTNYEGNPANIELLIDNREHEWEGIHENRDREPDLTYWTDKDPDVCTTVLDSTSVPEGFRTWYSTDSEQRNVVVEDNTGFIAVKLIDYLLTAKYHAKLLNVFRGRDRKLHMGLLTFHILNHPQLGMRPAVTCNHGECNYGPRNPFFFTLEPTRRNMEDYVIAIIRHGNNHSPDWLRNRSDWTMIHSTTCDTLHLQDEPCNSNGAEIINPSLAAPETPEEMMVFLKEHMKHCTSTKCNCVQYESELWNEIYGKQLTNA